MGNSHGKPVVFTGQAVNLNHFRLLRVVGKGAFGKVRIVERKDTGLTFALKYIRKDEGRYIVVDLMNGGDLRFHISRKSFTEDAVRFWVAELGCALRYIHKQGIVHRDVKPDNILLDGDGHVHLADFNVASDYTPGKPLTSKSGTLAYLAPEVYEGRGYSTEVDWWGLGVTMYECIYNKRPFNVHRPHEELAKDIKRAKPKFPTTEPPVSAECQSAMASLMEKNRKKRIGGAGFHTFSHHPFLEDIDFDALERKEIRPVFVPSADKTNFDATYDLEELLLEEAPLEARARRQKPRQQLADDATDKEIREDELHRMVETLFEPFDYTAVAYPGVNPATGSVGEPPDWVRPSSEPQGGTSSSAEDTDISSRKEDSPEHSTYTPSAKMNGHAVDDHPPKTPGSANGSLERSSLSTRLTDSLSPPTARRLVNGANGASPSPGGGLSVVLDETGSWSKLGDRSATIPSDVKDSKEAAKPSGMLGFLSRKKGRGHSPKPRERGVLGREGARHVVD
ncbi:MAG: hypothetical protein M1824_005633 [Vezdaea acicularis]|nr:MAG: hypothetical protein M1824_005633 [Vezdaea acicularis]